MASPKILGGGSFVSPFEWNENSIVIIKYKHGGGHIRAHPHNHELCDHKGGQTEWAKWKVHLSDNGRIAQLEHVKTGKYLQMDKFVSCINVASEGGSTSRWIVHPVSSNCVRLESERNEGYFLGVKPHDGVTVVNGENLDSSSYQYQFTYLYFFIEGQKDEGYFKKPYLLQQQNTIIIKHPLNATLRTNPSDERELDINGQKEMNARWEAIVTNGDSIENKTNNSSIKPIVSSPSESNNSSSIGNNSGNSSTSMASAASDSSLDINATTTTTTTTTDTQNGSTNENDLNDNDTKNLSNGSTNENEIETETKTDENNNNNNDNHNNNTLGDSVKITDGSDPLSDSKEPSDIDKNRKQQSSDSKDDDSDVYDDSHEKTNYVLQFRSVKSGGFIKLHDNRITMSRKGDDYTKFRVYMVEHPNIVKLESTQHPGCYIRITEKKGIHVGKGGPHCQMTLLRKE